MDRARNLWHLALAVALTTTSLLTIAPAKAADPPIKPAKCSKYIESGEWVWYFDEWSLQLVPTSCGRQIREDETPDMFYEIVKKFGDPETFGGPANPDKDRWRNVKGMIDQLTCHLSIARNKPTWNMEPYRPWVGYDATVKADCNPYVRTPGGRPHKSSGHRPAWDPTQP